MANDINEKAPNPRNTRPQGVGSAGPRPAKAPAGRPDAMDTSGLGRVVVRNEFYRDGYRLALRVAVIQSIVIFGLIGAMFFIIHVHQPENRYFATTEDGRLIPDGAADATEPVHAGLAVLGGAVRVGDDVLLLQQLPPQPAAILASLHARRMGELLFRASAVADH